MNFQHLGSLLGSIAGCHPSTIDMHKPFMSLCQILSPWSQDIIHRLSVPSRDAGRPRYSLVFKLVMVPRNDGRGTCNLSRPEWGRPTAFGSAARAERLVELAAKKRKLEAAVMAAAAGS